MWKYWRKGEAGCKPSFAAKIHIERKDLLWKNNFVIFNYLTLSLCSCVNSQTANTQSTTSNQQTTTDSVSEPTSVPATEQPKQKNKGTVSGKYDVEIVTAKTATDFQGNPAIIVTYNLQIIVMPTHHSLLL